MSARPLKWTRHADLAIERGIPIHRDEYLDHMTFMANERPLFTEIFGPLIGLKEEWEAQGATPEELSFAAFRYRAPIMFWIPVSAGFHGGPPEELVEETDEARITRDRMGRLMKLAKGASTLALPMTYPVEMMDDWLRIKRHYLFTEDRFPSDWEERTRAAADRGEVIVVGMPGGYDEPRQLMGEENLSYALYDQPELIGDMMETMGRTVARVIERVAERVQIDVLYVHEDMAGVSGPLMGPDHVRTFVAPYYRKAWEAASGRGARLFDQDSDGDMRSLLPVCLDAGVNCMHPMEPAAHMDIVEIRRTYGQRLAFYGGLDKHVLRASRNAIEAELERKIPPLLETGGCVLGLDHRIPNGTPLANYRFYLGKVWEMLDRFTP